MNPTGGGRIVKIQVGLISLNITLKNPNLEISPNLFSIFLMQVLKKVLNFTINRDDIFQILKLNI
jgi:hypothetical protein